VRLLLRANSYDADDTGGTRIAASPDTPGRERWQWELGIAQTHPPGDDSDGGHIQSVRLLRSADSTTRVVLTADPRAVSAALATLDLSEPAHLARDPRELLALVVGRGVALAEGRHVLGELDTVVLAGDDPTDVRVEQISEEPVSLAVVRLRPAGTDGLAWVP
jgi:hypothetical protein